MCVLFVLLDRWMYIQSVCTVSLHVILRTYVHVLFVCLDAYIWVAQLLTLIFSQSRCVHSYVRTYFCTSHMLYVATLL